MAIKDLIPWGRENRTLPTSYRNEENPFLTLHREINRLFEDALGRSLSPSFGGGVAWPNVELTSDEKQVKVTAELPGMEEKDVELTLEKDALILSGEKRSETEDRSKGYSERYYGRFERVIPLPYEVNEDACEASFSNGVLTVTLPKSPNAQSRGKRIEINGGAGSKH